MVTPSQTVGPFFAIGMTRPGAERLVAEDDPDAVRIDGRVRDGAGAPVPDAVVEIWQANRHGRYAHPKDAREDRPLEDGFAGFGRCGTDAVGRFSFVTVKPGAVPPHAPHLAVCVLARGLLLHLWTRMYFPDEEAANAADPLLRAIAEDERRATRIASRAAAGALAFDIRLQGERETVFLAF